MRPRGVKSFKSRDASVDERLASCSRHWVRAYSGVQYWIIAPFLQQMTRRMLRPSLLNMCLRIRAKIKIFPRGLMRRCLFAGRGRGLLP